ncbi:MAG: hypothetical protein A2V70_12275 [Planctomycetes bacterium RBG_13_63_9]|nr:MAG: hypothetical protein A2V70_12275 [Planctomycetes bacterium RBG_13_63_9]
MPISIECQGCGRKFRAPEELAGKRAKCPQCSAVIQVGARPPQPSGQVTSGENSVQPIPITCSCGKKFRARADLAGKRVKCPACGQALAIPGAGTATGTAPTGSLDFDQLMAAETAAATLSHSPLVPSKESKKRTNASNTRLIVGLSVATGVVMLVLVVLLWPSGDNAELAKEGTAPSAQPPETGKVPLSPPPPPPGAADVRAAPSGQPAPPAPAAPRRYPSFPDAMTEPPPWNDAKPLFDLAEFLKAPPDEENAAPLYLDALFEFSCDVAILFPEVSREEQERQYAIYKQRSDEYQRLDEAWEKDHQSVDNAAVDAWLANYEVGFEKLAAAQQRPKCVFQTGRSLHSLFPHIQAARQVARVVTWRTRRDLQHGDLQRPLQDLKMLLRLKRDLQVRGLLVTQLVSVAVDGQCCELVRMILNAPGVQVEHCDRLLALLAEHEAKAIDPFVEGNRAEYICYRLALHDLQHRTGSFDPQTMKKIWGIQGDVTSPLACFRVFTALGGRSSPEQLAKLAATLQGKLLPGAWSGGKMLSDQDYAKEVDALNRFFASILALAEQPRSLRQEMVDIEAAQALVLEKTLFAKLLIPAESTCLRAIRRNEAILRGTQCLIALRRWQLEHEELPKDLDTLVKAAGMPGVPIDPFSDRPLLMTVIEGKAVIYSVGPDGKDDKALSESMPGTGEPGDLIFRLGPPSD